MGRRIGTEKCQICIRFALAISLKMKTSLIFKEILVHQTKLIKFMQLSFTGFCLLVRLLMYITIDIVLIISKLQLCKKVKINILSKNILKSR